MLNDDQLTTFMMREVEWKSNLAVIAYNDLVQAILKGRNSPEVRAAWDHERSPLVAERDRLFDEINARTPLDKDYASLVARRRAVWDQISRVDKKYHPGPSTPLDRQWHLVIAFVSAASQVSLLFDPSDKKARNKTVVASLRSKLIEGDKSPVMSRDVRDYLQHSDERLEKFVTQKDGSSILHSIIDNASAGIRTEHFDVFDPVSMEVWIFDQSRTKQSPHLRLNLNELGVEIQRIHSEAERLLSGG